MTEYEDLYRSYFKEVFLYIKSLANDEHIAEDITSETFLKAIQSIDSFKGNCDIRIWLCQIAKNCYFSYLRKHKKLTNLDTIAEPADDIDIEVAMNAAETSMQIHEVLHNLKEPYKEVFSLRTFGELSFKQIAALFGKSENWACVTYHRARKRIIEGMEELQ
ncbi:MAG: sigma-70 family RNA polymerase sigma factor [Eubacteriales bacterium]|nr:sigma-70 family RNA polymerase sigma factor [Eubacteriales bacterium]